MKIQITGRDKITSFIASVCCLIAASTVIAQTPTNRKPVLAVIEFEVRPQINRAVGREMSDLLVNALLESQRFTVVDRAKTKEIQDEQIKVLMGSVDPATGAAIGKLTGAQFLLLGSVTEFKEKESKLGIFGKTLGIPGADKVVSYQAIVKFNLRVINSTTGEIAFSKDVEKKVENTGLSGDGSVLGVTVSDSFESKAMRNAVEQVMQEAVATLVERVGSTIAPSNTVAETSVNSSVDCSRVIGAKAPRIMVVIPEIHITQRIPDPAGETEIIKKLVERRFNVVDQKQISAIRDREKVLVALKNPAAAAALGIEFGADIIIIGEAFSELAARQGNLISTRSRVEARAIQTDNARILAADGKFGSGLDIAEFVSAKTALRNAGSQWADYFVTRICQAPDAKTEIASGIEIVIASVNYAQLKRFADTLETIPGVSGVEKKLTGSVARITVQYSGSAEKLADAITEAKFLTLRVNIVGLSGSEIDISIAR
ncbi:MAG: CsgG/HfaB family protein [Pyrinomonadaceae bacterium]|nr:CsgG/HfaB family protein [Pyrinomonadaceae bacterium]